MNGLQIGTVASNEDPEGEHRVRVRMPLVNEQADGVWARVASLDAGNQRGFFFRPEIGDEVVVGFLKDDPRRAVILGMLTSSAKPAPLKGSDDNHEKVYQSRTGMRLYFNDDKKVVLLETPAGNRVTLRGRPGPEARGPERQQARVHAQGGRLESARALEIKAAGELKLSGQSARSSPVERHHHGQGRERRASTRPSTSERPMPAARESATPAPTAAASSGRAWPR